MFCSSEYPRSLYSASQSFVESKNWLYLVGHSKSINVWFFPLIISGECIISCALRIRDLPQLPKAKNTFSLAIWQFFQNTFAPKRFIFESHSLRKTCGLIGYRWEGIYLCIKGYCWHDSRAKIVANVKTKMQLELRKYHLWNEQIYRKWMSANFCIEI